MAFRATQRRRTLEDLFLAGAVLGAGLLLLWSSHLLQERITEPFAAAALRSLAGLQSAAGLSAGWAGLLVLAWWGIGAASALVSAMLLRSGNRRAARAVGRFSPDFLRRLAAAALGVQLAAAPLPALASTPAGTGHQDAVPASRALISPGRTSAATPAELTARSPAVDPGWQPSPVTGSGNARSTAKTAEPGWQPSPAPVDSSLLIPGTPRGHAAPGATVTVRAGDTLWGLAAAQLGPHTTDSEVASQWPAWHEANRDVIGPDPHRLLPGQILAVPAAPAN